MSTVRRHVEMQKLTPAQQQELIARYQHRKDIRAMNDRLRHEIVAWLIGGPELPSEIIGQVMEAIHAGGHWGEYHENPNATMFKRASVQFDLPYLHQRLADTPLDYMGAIELSYVYARILLLLEALAQYPSGDVREAIRLYRAIGEIIRQKVYDEMGYWPESFPVPEGRITGLEAEKWFRPSDFQPALLEEEDA